MGARGRVPKRSDQRRRTNSPEPEKVELPPADVTVPEPDGKWHEVAVAWYSSLKDSGQSKFYEASDWATAYLIAENISRELKPQVVSVVEETGEPVWASVPMKGATLGAYLKAMSTLLVTEGDRRRAGVELRRASAAASAVDHPAVAELDDYRARLAN